MARNSLAACDSGAAKTGAGHEAFRARTNLPAEEKTAHDTREKRKGVLGFSSDIRDKKKKAIQESDDRAWYVLSGGMCTTRMFSEMTRKQPKIVAIIQQ